MAKESVGAWNTAIGAAGDVFRGFGLFKTAYLGLFFCTAIQQFMAAPLNEKPAEAPLTSDDAVAMFVLFGVGFFAVPFAIQLWRYFAAGDTSWSYGFRRPFWRIVGWGLGLCILAGLYMFAAVIIFLFISVNSEVAGVATFLLLLLLLAWIVLRLATFYPALALDEPKPLFRRCFRETKGWVWFLVRTALAAVVVLIPLVALLIAWQMLIYGPEAFNDPDVGLPPLEANMRFADAIVTGAIVTLLMIYQGAVSGRVYRAVRGS
jgi:hypothetical protein